MARQVTRYGGGSRKLYDTEDSRYVSLEDIAAWIRAGQEVRVLDRASGTDVTAQTLAQVIYESHRRGDALLPVRLLHEIIRQGEEALTSGVEQLQQGVGRLVRTVRDVPPVRRSRTDFRQLRRGLARLEESLASLERPRAGRKG